MSQREMPAGAEPFVGTFCLVTGVTLVVVVVAVRLEGLWHLPTGLIRRNPMLMLGVALALVLTGSRMLWKTRDVATVWAPSRRGRRFRRVVLYTKPNCPLCEAAAGVLAAYRPFLPRIETILITGDVHLESRYERCAPVVEIDGRKRFVGQINEVLLRRLIEGTSPQPE